MAVEMPCPRPETRQKAIEATRRHILDVKAGRVRLKTLSGKLITPIDQYIKEEMQRLNLLIGEVSE